MNPRDPNPLLRPSYAMAGRAISFSFDLRREESYQLVNEAMGPIFELLEAMTKETVDGSQRLMEELKAAVKLLQELQALEPTTTAWSAVHLGDLEKQLEVCQETYEGEDFERYYGAYVARTLLQNH